MSRPNGCSRPTRWRCSSAPRSRCWRSTRRIASRNGVTTSGPNTRRSARCRRNSAACRPSAFTATADAATRTDILDKLFSRAAGVVRARLRPAQPAAGDAGQGRRPQTDRGFRRRSSRRQSGIVYCASRRKTEELADFLRGSGVKALPYHAGMDGAARSRNQDAFLQEDGVVDGRDRGVRHGHRQAGRALRAPRRHAGQHRKLLPGDRPRRPRRAAGRYADALRHGRHPAAPHADRRKRRLRRAEARRPPAAQRAGLVVRIAALPAADAARLFRRDRRSHAAIAISAATAPR